MRRDRKGPEQLLEETREIGRITGHTLPCVAEGCFEPSGNGSLLCEKHQQVGEWYFHTQIADDPRPHIQKDIQLAHDWAWTYFVGSREMGFVKIGVTKRLRHRMASLRSNSPVPVKLMALVCGSEFLESYFHEKFQDERMHSEWFTLSDRIAESIELIKQHRFSEIIPRKYLFTTEEKIACIARNITYDSVDERERQEEERIVDRMRNLGQY